MFFIIIGDIPFLALSEDKIIDKTRNADSYHAKILPRDKLSDFFRKNQHKKRFVYLEKRAECPTFTCFYQPLVNSK